MGRAAPEAVIAHTNLYWRFEAAPGRRGRTVTTGEVDFVGSPAADR